MVAERRAGPACEDGGGGAFEGRLRWTADTVDAWVDAVEAPELDAVLDLAVSEAEAHQLLVLDIAVKGAPRDSRVLGCSRHMLSFWSHAPNRGPTALVLAPQPTEK